MNSIHPRKAILAGLLGLGTVAGFGSGIASMGCGGHRRAEHAQWASKHHGAGCDQRAAAAPAAAAPAPTPTPPEAAPAPVPPEETPTPTPAEPGQE